jgi:Ca2+-binding EF-hand superfamily protein
LEFTNDELKKLQQCFNQLDEDHGGSIGIDELEGPLIGLGFAQNREEVMKMIDQVDDDGTGAIEFEEFLCIIKNASPGHENGHMDKEGRDRDAGVDKFFKDMANGKVGKKDLSFGLNV